MPQIHHPPRALGCWWSQPDVGSPEGRARWQSRALLRSTADLQSARRPARRKGRETSRLVGSGQHSGAESRRGLPEWTALISPQKAPLILGTPRCLRQGSPHPRFWRSQAELTFDTQPATLADGCGGDRVSLARGGGYVGGPLRGILGPGHTPR